MIRAFIVTLGLLASVAVADAQQIKRPSLVSAITDVSVAAQTYGIVVTSDSNRGSLSCTNVSISATVRWGGPAICATVPFLGLVCTADVSQTKGQVIAPGDKFSVIGTGEVDVWNTHTTESATISCTKEVN